MPGAVLEDDAADSRTASVGLVQSRRKGLSSRGSQASRSKRRRGLTKKDWAEFVPRGSRFTESILAVNSGTEESCGSESTRASDTDMEDSVEEPVSSTPQAPSGPGGSQPSINWNRYNKGPIRTKLRPSGAVAQRAPASGSFEQVNDRYWRGRSASTSSAGPNDETPVNGQGGQNQGDSATNALVIFDSSDDSDSGDMAEGDDSIVLNMGSVETPGALDTANADDRSTAKLNGQSSNGLFDGKAQANGSPTETTPAQAMTPEERSVHREKKEAALRAFNSKYSTSPTTLSELHRDDLELQAKYIFYNKPIEELDLHLPVRCIDCLSEGHLADVCPDKECQHCGAWACHESRFCPTWRRCQRCRERGHDEKDCPSLLRELPSAVPCDLCASHEHTESDCDMIWKVPMSKSHDGPIFISVSCCYCTSMQHLLGDCPRRPFPMNSSSWSLKTYDPSLLSSHPSLADLQAQEGGQRAPPSQVKIKRRPTERMSSPDSDDALSRFGHSVPINREPTRKHIRFDNSIARGRSFGQDSKDRHVPDRDRQAYRDREHYFGHNTRQRSLSPMRQYPRRGDGPGRRPPLPSPRSRSPPRPQASTARSRSRGRGAGGTSGRGKAAKSLADTRDTYRLLPSAGKKAWAKYRS
ncbi:hypothetical protein VTO42DRAFT_7941 [Malbranchea cinnamomea]